MEWYHNIKFITLGPGVNCGINVLFVISILNHLTYFVTALRYTIIVGLRLMIKSSVSKHPSLFDKLPSNM